MWRKTLRRVGSKWRSPALSAARTHSFESRPAPLGHHIGQRWHTEAMSFVSCGIFRVAPGGGATRG
eukprot:1696018-Alexandrium_andersonii.AAC.1